MQTLWAQNKYQGENMNRVKVIGLRPSDSVEKIDYQNMEKIARAIYATAWELANRPTLPRVDKPLPAEGTGN
jgi:hypothetical protein